MKFIIMYGSSLLQENRRVWNTNIPGKLLSWFPSFQEVCSENVVYKSTWYTVLRHAWFNPGKEHILMSNRNTVSHYIQCIDSIQYSTPTFEVDTMYINIVQECEMRVIVSVDRKEVTEKERMERPS